MFHVRVLCPDTIQLTPIAGHPGARGTILLKGSARRGSDALPEAPPPVEFSDAAAEAYASDLEFFQKKGQIAIDPGEPDPEAEKNKAPSKKAK